MRPRRKERLRNLDAAQMPIELALLERASQLDEYAGKVPGMLGHVTPKTETARFMAEEFRLLAEELHWW